MVLLKIIYLQEIDLKKKISIKFDSFVFSLLSKCDFLFNLLSGVTKQKKNVKNLIKLLPYCVKKGNH